MNPATIRKIFTDLPFAHRQPNHDGHCALIHGHNWSFEFTFAAKSLDKNGFVVDFGDLKWLRAWLEEHFDHTLVLNEDDPQLDYLTTWLTSTDGHRPVMARIVTVPNCGAEGLARYVAEQVDETIRRMHLDRVRVQCVTVYEDSKNSATYTIPCL